jgi:RNA polymerase sigma factor (sigma-70 family)
MAVPVSPVDMDFEKLRADLLRAMRQICPPQLADHAEDIVQIAILRVMERHRATGGDYPFEYYKRTAYTVMIDEIRRRRREVPLPNPDGPGPRDTRTPDQKAAAKELRGTILECLAGLASDRRRAVTLRLFGSHSVPYIARQLEISLKQADNLISRGRRDLRACLEARGVKR